jgi:glutamate racemase
VFFLRGLGAKTIVVACNTTSAASLSHLREIFETPVSGIEPVGRPDAERGE